MTGLNPRDGTGNTPTEAEIDALEYVVEEGRIASMDDYGILRSLLVRVRPEWENQSYKESDEKRTNTTMNRDTTPGDGSVQGEGTVGMADIAYGAAENLQGVCTTFDQWSRETAGVMYRLARHIELLESQVPSDAEREAISMAYSRLTADAKYEEVAATLKALLERTNHDAVPAAKAEEPESSVPLGSGSALANTSEPVAWVAFATDGSESSAVYSMQEQAQAAADEWGWSFAPLYAHLPLTNKELAALEWFEEVRKPLNSFNDGEYVATLRSLLERMK
jgi:hypothetical protein